MPQVSRSLPARPDLAQQKKQAKDLLHAFAAGATEAQARVRAVLPDKPRIALADAQFVIAREYGFASWTALKQHIDTSTTAAARSPELRLHDAFRERDASTVRGLLERHAEFRPYVNAPVCAFDAPPIVACANDLAMINVLLDFGADPNQRSSWWAGGFHALHSATGVAAERLLAAGAIPDACAAAQLDRPELLAEMLADDPSRVNERGGDGQTPLHFAKSRAVVDLLLAAGADLDARDLDHRGSAAEWMLDGTRNAGRYELARYLAERGASTDIFLAAALGLTSRARTLLHDTPAHLALRTGRGAYGEQPPSSFHIYFWTIGANRSPLDVAAQFDQQETLAALLEVAPPRERLRFAAWRADATGAKRVVHEHPDTVSSMTPEDHRAITDAAWNGNAEAVAVMMELGFDPRTPGHDAGTALHCAAWQGSAATVAALLRHRDARALVAIRDTHHDATPLGWCCHGSRFGKTRHDHAAVATLLLEAGARPGADTREASPAVEAVLAGWRGGA